MKLLVGSSTVDLDVHGLLSIDDSDLESEFQNQTSRFARVAELLVEAKAALDTAELLCDTKKAEASLNVRKQLSEQGEKATEDKIKSTVKTLSVIQTAESNRIECEKVYETLRLAVRGLEHRREMLIQLGRARRSELSDLSLQYLKNRGG